MSVGRRLLDLARANLNALLDRAERGELEGRSEEELQAELERRRRERAAQDEDRERRLAAEAAAKQRGQARGPAKAGAKKPPPRPPRAPTQQERVVELHRTLGVRLGASRVEIKTAYRALMREHHPDRHAGDPAKQKTASDRAAQITTAYTDLLKTKK